MNSTLNSQVVVEPGSWNAWLVALRPKTLWIAVVPVFVGTSLAVAETGRVNPLIALLALAASILLQILTNLQNDVGYTKRGAETASRIGLPRATARGWLTIAAVHRALVLVVIATVLVGLPIVLHGGWPVLLMGLTSIIAAWAYMGGPRPIAYTPFGELTVFVFFGLIAAVGSYYIQTGSLGPSAWLTGCAIGLIAAAALAVNNIRDCTHDAEVGRRTLVVVLGKPAAERAYQVAVLLPYALTAALALTDPRLIGLLAVMLTLPAALGLVRDLPRTPPGLPYNAMLFRTFKLELLFGACFTIGALVPGLLPGVR
ncbi:MAG: 1,4-dihydroxy-2-naphthoate octaprenyltransferase [Burkholderiaceae bacterium]